MKIKMKRIVSLLLTLLIIVSCSSCSLLGNEQGIGIDKDVINQVIDGVANQITGTDDTSDAAAVPSIENEKISITMLDVGQGLSMLIESNDEYLLYDGGDRNASSYVVSYLQKHDVDHLEYMFASHYDDDHINGLVGVLNTVDVDTVINPDYETDTKVYNSYQTKLKESGADVIYPSVGDTYTLGYSTITVLAPARDYGDANEMSVAIKIQCDDFVCIITGDAESESEADMLNNGIDLDADLYVVGHHGSSSSSTDAFVKAMSPDYAFISCGANNDYGHPTDKTLSTLAKYDVAVYRSDVDGVVTCSSDGENYTFSKELSQFNNDDNSEADEGSVVYEGEYVLNTNSMKFHYPDCSAVENMSEKNKEISAKSREELLNDGYSPCGYCDP